MEERAAIAHIEAKTMPDDLYPRRIVSLQPSATVTLARLGCLDRVVACTRYCLDVVPELREAQCRIVADSWTANREQILAAQPDFVVASVPYQQEAVADILKAGVRFLGLAPHSLNDIYTDIMMIAAVVGRPAQGHGVVAAMQQEIAFVRRHIEATQRPRLTVFCEEWGKPLIASQGWVAELVEAAGGEFIGEPGKQVTPETIQAADPDVLVAAWCGAGDRVPLEKIVAQRGWNKLRAVRQGRVYCIPDEFLNTPAPTLLEGLHALAAALHPSLFPESRVPRAIRATPLPVSLQEKSQ
jgi:iron complex transport system substrate-binding protein